MFMPAETMQTFYQSVLHAALNSNLQLANSAGLTVIVQTNRSYTRDKVDIICFISVLSEGGGWNKSLIKLEVVDTNRR